MSARLGVLLALFAWVAGVSPSLAAASDPVLEAPAMRWPTPATRRLSNGLQVAVFPRPGSHVVQLQLTVAAGSATEGARPQGTAAMLAALLRSGTSSRSAEQFQRDLEALGGSMNMTVSRDNAVVVAAFLSNDLDQGIELVSDAIVNAILPETELQSARRLAVSTLAPLRGSAAWLADETAWRAAFAPHPYARSSRGSLEGLLSLTREDLRSLHRDRWRPDRAALVVAGDVDSVRAFALADEWFGRWSGRTAVDPERPAPEPVTRAITFVDAPAVRAEIRLFQLAPARGNRERDAWAVAAQWLQGSDRLPPGARVTLEAQRDASVLAVQVQAPIDSVDAVLRAVRTTLQSVAKRPPTSEQLAAAEANYRRTQETLIETLGGLAAQWSVGRAAGLPDDHLPATAADLGAPMASVRMQAVWAALARPWVVVVAGPPELEARLAKLGPVERARTIPAPAAAVVAPPSAAARARGREVSAAAIAAHGGLARFEAVRSVSTEGEIEFPATGGQVSARFSAVRAGQDRYFMSTSVLDASMQQVLVGDRAWTVTASAESVSVRDLDSSGVAIAKNLIEGDLVAVLLAAMRGDPVWRAQESLDGRQVEIVEFSSPRGVAQRMLVDSKTHRVVALDFGLTERGDWVERHLLSEYKLIGGIWLPFIEDRRMAGQPLAVTIVRRAVINSPVDARIFEHPAPR